MEIVFLLEEKSAKVMLEYVLPKIFPENTPHATYICFEGKQDLKKQINKKIKFYRGGCENIRFLVMCDRDSNDCKQLKKELLEKIPQDKKNKTLIRIACGELESFYLGDLQAVEKGLKIKNLCKKQANQKFRKPDSLNNAFQELSKLTNNKYQKVAGSKSIAKYLDIDNNTSQSFGALISAIK